MTDDDYLEGDSTPSQAALDAQMQQGNLVAAANYQGRIALAKTQVMEAVQEGADSAAGRELLGRLDQMSEFPESEDAEDVYKVFKTFIKGGVAPVAPSDQKPPKPKVDLNKARQAYAEGHMTTKRAQELGIV